MNPFYINPAYKSSIFNTSVSIETSPIPNRASKENVSRSQERVTSWKQNYDSNNSFTQDNYFRQKRWDYKDRSLDESRCGSSMDQSLVKASQDMGIRSFNEENRKQAPLTKEVDQNRSRTSIKLQENSNRQPLRETKDFNKIELEIAIHQKTQHCRDQLNYKKELDKQVREKHKSKRIDELVDLSYSKSGLPIGEVHGGLDIEDQAKIMRIKANNKARSESQEVKVEPRKERSFSMTKEEESQIQNYGSNSYRGSSLSFYNERKALAKSFIERVEEESDSHSQASPKRSMRAAGLSSNAQNNQNRKRKAENQSESILNPLGSKYTLKKACHEKLRDALKSQYKKYEDYTAKLLEDSKKRKHVLMDDVENQMAKDQFKKQAMVFRDKELGKQHKEIEIGEKQHLESLLQMKEAQLTKITQRCISREKPTKQKSARTKEEREGTYMRVVNDTINQLLNKRAKLVEQAQKRTTGTERKAVGK